MKHIDRLPVQLILAALLAFMAFDDFFATALTAAYRLDVFMLAEGLGRLTPGDDLWRLMPLMDAAPPWLHGLWLLAGGLYLAAMAGLFSLKKWAPPVVMAAAPSKSRRNSLDGLSSPPSAWSSTRTPLCSPPCSCPMSCRCSWRPARGGLFTGRPRPWGARVSAPAAGGPVRDQSTGGA